MSSWDDTPIDPSELAHPLETRATVLARLKAALPTAGAPAGETAGPLAALNRDESGDPAIALLDAFATLADQLYFYQERLRSEGYLRTAVEPRSVASLVRMLGVQPYPPLAARADLAFTLVDYTTAPEQVTIAKGAQVQSVPAQGGMPEVFETLADLDGRPEWSAMTPPDPADQLPSLALAARGVIIKSSSTGVRPGDALLIFGTVNDQPWPGTVKIVRHVGTSPKRGVSLIVWGDRLGDGDGAVADAVIYTCRSPEALLGHDAADWNKLPNSDRALHSPMIGGLMRRGDSDASFVGLEHGAPLGTILSIAAVDETVVVGVQESGVLRSTDGGKTWLAGNGFQPKTDALALGADFAGRLVAGTRKGLVLRSSDGGKSWDTLRGGSADRMLPGGAVRAVIGFIGGAGATAAGFLMAGTDDGVYLWDEAGAGWRGVNAGLPLTPTASSRAPVTVRCIAVDPPSGRFVIGTDQGLFSTVDLSAGWSRFDPAAPRDPVSAVAFDDSGQLFVALDRGAIYRTSDAKTWTQLQNPAAGAVVTRAILPRRGSAGLVDVATSAGVFRARITGGLATWSDLGAGLTSRDTTGLARSGSNALYAATTFVGVVDKEWPGFPLPSGAIDLARVVTRVAVGDPVGLLQRDPTGQATAAQLCTVRGISSVEDDPFLTAKEMTKTPKPHTRFTVDNAKDLSAFDRRRASALLPQSRLQASPSQPRTDAPLDQPDPRLDALLNDDTSWAELTRQDLEIGEAPTTIVIEGAVASMADRPVLISGKRRRVRIPSGAARTLISPDGLAKQPINAGDVLTALGRPTPPDAEKRRTWHLETEHGFEGLLTTADALILLDGGAADPVAERNNVIASDPLPGATRLVLDGPITEFFDPASITVYGNVVASTQGASFSEALGGGSGAANQRFKLRRQPLTWLDASDDEHDVEVWVSGRRWTAVDSWIDQTADANVYVLALEPDGTTTVTFGDGVRGALPPSGQDNISARYRYGTSDGSAGAQTIRLLRNRSPGLKSVMNPLPSGGGVAAEPNEDLRRRAPLAVRTLDRIVSLTDYEDFVRAYRGVARASARMVWDGSDHSLFITVATVDDSEHRLQPGSVLALELERAMARPDAQLRTVTFASMVPKYFDVAAALTIDPDHDPSAVLPAAESALDQAFAFEQRQLAQHVAASDVVRVLAEVEGVANVRLTRLAYSEVENAPKIPVVLRAADARWNQRARTVEAAEMLILNAAHGVTLTVEAAP